MTSELGTLYLWKRGQSITGVIGGRWNIIMIRHEPLSSQ